MTTLKLREEDIITIRKVYKTKFKGFFIKEVINNSKSEYKLCTPNNKTYWVCVNSDKPNFEVLSVFNINEADNIYTKRNYSNLQGSHNTIWQSILDNSYLPHKVKVNNREIVITDKEELEGLITGSLALRDVYTRHTVIKDLQRDVDLGNGQIIEQIDWYNHKVITSLSDKDPNDIIKRIELREHVLALKSANYNTEGNLEDITYHILYK